MLLIAGLIHNRSSGGAVHAAAHGGKSGGVPVRFVPDELTAGLRPPGTLVLVSISGGGFRAAYFAAAVLQELQHIRIDKAAGLNSLLAYNIGLLSAIESVN